MFCILTEYISSVSSLFKTSMLAFPATYLESTRIIVFFSLAYLFGTFFLNMVVQSGLVL